MKKMEREDLDASSFNKRLCLHIDKHLVLDLPLSTLIATERRRNPC
jgi:hypothetical protein